MYDLFRTTARDLGTAGFDYQYGYGLIDPVTAFSTATNQHIPESNAELTIAIALLPAMFGLAFVTERRVIPLTRWQ